MVWARVVGTATTLGTGRYGHRIEARFPTPVQTGLRAHPVLGIGYRVFPGLRVAGAWR